MSSLNKSIVYASLATELRDASSLSCEQRLFRQVILDTRSTKNPSELSEIFFSRFDASRTPEDFLDAFKTCCSNQTTLRDIRLDEKTLHCIIQKATQFLAREKFVYHAVAMKQLVMTPIWGVLCAIRTIMQSILGNDEGLILIDEHIEKCIKQYAILSERSMDLDQRILSSLGKLNAYVIDFAFNIVTSVLQNKSRQWRRLVKSMLQDDEVFDSQLLESTTQGVDRAKLDEINRAQDYTAMSVVGDQITVEEGTKLYGVPNLLSQHFTGRKVELSEIQEILHDTPAIQCRTCVLTGIGGIGKTQLALQYIQASLHTKYNHVIFARADSAQVLAGECTLLAEQFGLCDGYQAETQRPKVMIRLAQYLACTDNWLLVLDNVTKADDVSVFLSRPSGSGNRHVLFTTRGNDVASELSARGKIVPIGTLDIETEGIELIHKLDPTQNIGDNMRARHWKVAEFTRGVPLAIENFIKFSSEVGTEKAFEAVHEKSAMFEQENPKLYHAEVASVATIQAASLSNLQARNPAAASLFKMLIHLSPGLIQNTTLYTAIGGQDDCLQIASTFKKRQARSPADIVRLSREDVELQRKFCLWDYDPFKLGDYGKLLRKATKRRRMPNLILPNFDSPYRTELQNLWVHEKCILNALFESGPDTWAALRDLESTGFIRFVNDGPAIWVHDLCVESTLAILRVGGVR